MIDLFLPEGATPIEDISDLKLPWLKTRAQLNQVEAENILAAYTKYFSRKRDAKTWFSAHFLKQVHKDMFGKVWNWAGIFYKGPARNIGVRAFHIPTHLNELCEDVHFWIANPKDLSILDQSVRIHHRLAKIHPFSNGNGRHARFIADLYLHSFGAKRPQWPEANLYGMNNQRKEYITSMKEADSGDYSALLELTKKYSNI